MTQRHRQAGDGRLVRRYDYPDRSVFAVDVTGGEEGVESVSVDTVDGTAIVVVETETDSETFEFEVPGEVTETTANNGVVTVEVAP